MTVKNKCDIGKVKIGDTFSRFSHGTVTNMDYGGIELTNEDGFKWSIGNQIVEAEIYFADQFDETVELTRTELATKIIEWPRINMTVHFNKKSEHKDLVDLESQAYLTH